MNWIAGLHHVKVCMYVYNLLSVPIVCVACNWEYGDMYRGKHSACGRENRISRDGATALSTSMD